MKALIQNILRWTQKTWLQPIILFLKRTSLPGFFQVPIYDVLVLIIKELRRDDILTRANGMAFNFFLSLFPILLILISFLPFIPIEGFEKTFYSSYFESLPSETQQFVQNTLKDLRKVNHGNIISASIFFAFFFASNGILSMIRGFEKSYEVSFRNRNFIKKRLIALWILFLLGSLVLGGCLLIVMGQSVRIYIEQHTSIGHINIILLSIAKWVFVFAIIYTMISSIYRFAPAFRKKTGFFSPGAMLTTSLIIITTLIFSFYLNRFDTYNRIYGSIGTIIATMVWIEINCFNLLIGFELNASIALNRDMKNLESDNIYI